MIAQYCDEAYNKDVIQSENRFCIIHANIGVLDAYWRILDEHTLHLEAQEMYTMQDRAQLGMWLSRI